MLLARLAYRRPGLGDEVTVLAGPYTGHSGRINDVGRDGRVRVFIDDCCQAIIEPSDARPGTSSVLGDRVERAHHIAERNTEVEYTRAIADARISPTGKPF